MKKRADRFFVGFVGPKQTLYGIDSEDGSTRWADPMTLTRAMKEAKKLTGGRTAIFELVQVAPAHKGKVRRAK